MKRLSVEAFIDANWGGLVTDRRSTTSYCTFVWENLVTWKKQEIIGYHK